MQPGQGAFDNPAEDAQAAAIRTAGLGEPWTLPAPWTPRTRPPPSLLVSASFRIAVRRVDETYVRVAGDWACLYRAVDSAGEAIESFCPTSAI
jgi:hypothetical protein